MSGNLQNKRILITRAEHQAEEFAVKVKQYGGNPYIIPLLKISCCVDRNHLNRLGNIQQYEWIFFTSANGVHCFFQIWRSKFGLRDLSHYKFAVVGRKTNKVLQQYGYEATFIPSIYNAETMATEFLKEIKPNRPILLVRGKQARQVLPEAFAKRDIDFDCLVVYETTVNDDRKDSLNRGLHYRHIDYITFTSPSAVEAFFSLLEDIKDVNGKEIVCIGTTTAKKAAEKGLNHIIVPEQFTIEGMITAISDHIAKKV